MGNYFCQVEGQTGYASISTVQDRDLPYVVNIPQGRPFVAFLEPGAVLDLPNVEERSAQAQEI